MTVLNIDTLYLDKGSHATPASPGAGTKVCLFEAYNLLAFGRFTAECPADVSPLLYRMGMNLNDSFGDDVRQLLKEFLPRDGAPSPLAGTAGDGQNEARGWLAIDWRIRTYTPAWLDLAGLTAEATALRDLSRIADRAAWTTQADAVNTKVWAALSAAAVVSAAADWAAVSAADAALKPTVEILQRSAVDLYRSMINPAAVTA